MHPRPCPHPWAGTDCGLWALSGGTWCLLSAAWCHPRQSASLAPALEDPAGGPTSGKLCTAKSPLPFPSTCWRAPPGRFSGLGSSGRQGKSLGARRALSEASLPAIGRVSGHRHPSSCHRCRSRPEVQITTDFREPQTRPKATSASNGTVGRVTTRRPAAIAAF